MQNNDWINLTFILIFALIVLDKLLFQKRFFLLTKTIFSKKYFSVYTKDSPLIASTFNLIFLPINILTISLSLFFLTEFYYPNLFKEYNFYTYLFFVLGLLLFFILKVILRFIVNIILSITKKARKFSFIKLSFRNLISLVLLPFLLLHQYSILDEQLTITLLLSIFITITAFQYLYSGYLIIADKHHSLFYIILYLCTLEIIPIVIYIKLILIVVNNSFQNL